MLLEVRLRDFRIHEEKDLRLEKGINLFHGENGSGKTSILEAIHLVLKGKSFRTASTADLIREGAESAVVIVVAEVKDARRTIARQLSRKAGMRMRIDGKDPTSKGLDMPIQTISFTQENIWTIKGEPGGRRDWIDDLVEQSYPEEEERMRDFRRALYQRNEMLKKIRAGKEREESLSPWEEIIAERGNEIKERRLEVLRKLEEETGRMMEKGEGERILLRYYGTFEDEEDLLKKLRKNRYKDISRGATGIGPHRDEILFLLDGRSLRQRGSQGQQRKAAVILTLASSALLESALGVPCIPMLDDMPSELDDKTIEWLIERISEREQVLVTANTNRIGGFERRAEALYRI